VFELIMNDQVLDHTGLPIEVEAFHPGEYLLEEIEHRKLIKKDVAAQLGILPHHLSEMFAGKRNISAKLAVKLEKALGISADYWISLQAHYDLQLAREEENTTLT
jgi:HTH-type transcriptional regulator/antitoxin HigA